MGGEKCVFIYILNEFFPDRIRISENAWDIFLIEKKEDNIFQCGWLFLLVRKVFKNRQSEHCTLLTCLTEGDHINKMWLGPTDHL